MSDPKHRAPGKCRCKIQDLRRSTSAREPLPREAYKLQNAALKLRGQAHNETANLSIAPGSIYVRFEFTGRSAYVQEDQVGALKPLFQDFVKTLLVSCHVQLHDRGKVLRRTMKEFDVGIDGRRYHLQLSRNCFCHFAFDRRHEKLLDNVDDASFVRAEISKKVVCIQFGCLTILFIIHILATATESSGLTRTDEDFALATGPIANRDPFGRDDLIVDLRFNIVSAVLRKV
ncbi:hypothetical protein KCU85_g129, partial [Aureobasidium melanogenum]